MPLASIDISDYFPLAWAVLAIAGLVGWGLVGCGGLWVALKVFLWAGGPKKAWAYAWAGLLLVSLAPLMILLLYCYFVAIGFLSIFLHPS